MWCSSKRSPILLRKAGEGSGKRRSHAGPFSMGLLTSMRLYAIQMVRPFQGWPCWISLTPLNGAGLPLTNAHNVRTSSHTFHIPQAGLCHGFAGYFESSLYGNVVMSIHPDPARFSKDMLSWFPIFFPFKVSLRFSCCDVKSRLTSFRRKGSTLCSR